MYEAIQSHPPLRNGAFGFAPLSHNGNGKAEHTEFGEILAYPTPEDRGELIRRYASLIIQLDYLRPKLASADTIVGEDEEWSVREILGHLIDADREIWWPRITAILQQDRPSLPSVDQHKLVVKNNWRSLALLDIFAQLMRTRWNFAMKLRDLSCADFEKTGVHATLGEISILRILQILVAHDSHYLDRIRSLTEEVPSEMPPLVP